MIDLKKLREEMEAEKSRGSTWGAAPGVVLQLLDQLEAAQRDAARYQYLERLKNAWAILGDIYDLPSEDEGAKDLGSSIDIAMTNT